MGASDNGISLVRDGGGGGAKGKGWEAGRTGRGVGTRVVSKPGVMTSECQTNKSLTLTNTSERILKRAQ